MASWKKIIVSGSDAALNSLTVSTCIVGNVCGTASNAVLAGNSNCLGSVPAACFVDVYNTQTIGGTKTFNSTIVASAGVCGTICNSNNLGEAPQACYVMMCGDQNVCGIKTFVADVCITKASAALSITAAGAGSATVNLSPNTGGTAEIKNISATLPTTLWTNGSERVRITSAGNVGIAETNPGCTLSVGGAICSSGEIRGANIITAGTVCAGTNIRGAVVCATSCFVGNFCGNATTATTAGNSNCLGGAPQVCYVMMCGNQSIAGVKTFSSCIVASGGLCGVASSAVTATTATTAGNSNCLGSAPQACYVMMCGDQAINGVKTFCSNVCGLGVVRGVNLCATTSICGPMVCVSGRVTGADICATGTICGPMVCVSGTVTAGTLSSCGNVNVTTELVSPSNCLQIRVGGTVRACIDSNGICTPNTVRAAQICSVGSICGAGMNVSGDSIVGGNATISGNLTVNGTLVYLNVTDLAVEDKFILLNSGSNVAREGGLIIDEGNPSGSGHAFIYDADSVRWGFTSSLSSAATSVTPDAFAAAVVTSDIVEYQKVGNIRISGEDIFIYS